MTKLHQTFRPDEKTKIKVIDMNTTVSFPIAKLLKEKGFDKPSYSFYVIDESEYGEIGEFITNPNDNYPALDDNSLFDSLASAPNIAEVVMWLYEKHGVWIEVTTDVYGKFCWLVKELKASNNNFNSPTEAYEAAIEYTLNNLI